ncbi:MAG: lactate dehydrogenase, partial [Loktanella sp.]|nr:lactate dehydrogenase [Loktanella sp.]
ALIIAEYQCDVTYRGQKEALAEFLPLDAMNWITCGNALQLDWLSICPPTGTGVKHHADDLFMSPVDQAEIDFENEGGETYICGNPPYLGSVLQNIDQKADLSRIFSKYTKAWKSLDYVTGWFMKAAEYGEYTKSAAAFVSTNSICQGEQVPILWPLIFKKGYEIAFAHTSFKWNNLASHNAGVTVIIVSISKHIGKSRQLFSIDDNSETLEKRAENINAYLVHAPNVIVNSVSTSISSLSKMMRGNMPNDGGFLLLDKDEADEILAKDVRSKKFIRKFIGAKEFINGLSRFCIWVEDKSLSEAMDIVVLADRINSVRDKRKYGGKQARDHANKPHRFVFAPHQEGLALAIPAITSENRDYLPVGVVNSETIVGAKCYVCYDSPLWNMALIASRLHWVWTGALSARLEMRLSYANTLCWNTFPVPKLTEKNKEDLTHCAEDILLAREAHFPATIADLYDPEKMPENLRAAHDHNDEVLERIYIGRRFRNNTERLEKLFELYTKMITKVSA